MLDQSNSKIIKLLSESIPTDKNIIPSHDNINKLFEAINEDQTNPPSYEMVKQYMSDLDATNKMIIKNMTNVSPVIDYEESWEGDTGIPGGTHDIAFISASHTYHVIVPIPNDWMQWIKTTESGSAELILMNGVEQDSVELGTWFEECDQLADRLRGELIDAVHSAHPETEDMDMHPKVTCQRIALNTKDPNQGYLICTFLVEIE